MSKSSLEEILNAHADELLHGQGSQFDSYRAAVSAQREEVEPLLALAEGLKRVLVPVQPPALFRSRLRGTLQMAGHHQAARQSLLPLHVPRWNYWWIGAAALGASVAAGGIIAWVMRSRTVHSHAN